MNSRYSQQRVTALGRNGHQALIKGRASFSTLRSCTPQGRRLDNQNASKVLPSHTTFTKIKSRQHTTYGRLPCCACRMSNNALHFYLLHVVHYKLTLWSCRDQQELTLLELWALSPGPGPPPRWTLGLRAVGFAPRDLAGVLVPSRDLEETLWIFLKPSPLSRG